LDCGALNVFLLLTFTCESSYCFQRILAITILSVHLSVRLFVRPSVRPSHGWISQKRCKLGSPNLHRLLELSILELCRLAGYALAKAGTKTSTLPLCRWSGSVSWCLAEGWGALWLGKDFVCSLKLLWLCRCRWNCWICTSIETRSRKMGLLRHHRHHHRLHTCPPCDEAAFCSSWCLSVTRCCVVAHSFLSEKVFDCNLCIYLICSSFATSLLLSIFFENCYNYLTIFQMACGVKIVCSQCQIIEQVCTIDYCWLWHNFGCLAICIICQLFIECDCILCYAYILTMAFFCHFVLQWLN